MKSCPNTKIINPKSGRCVLKSCKIGKQLLQKSPKKTQTPVKNNKKLTIGLFNMPCNGFGDIIVTKKFYECIKKWYPTMSVHILSTTPEKFKKLGFNKKVLKLETTVNRTECLNHNQIRYKGEIKFDYMFCIPVINDKFNLKFFQKCIPYATKENTFSVSEYNGFYKTDIQLGVGKNKLGLLFSKTTMPKSKSIKNPYTLVYIADVIYIKNAKKCFLSYMGMICEKYSKVYKNFDIVVPPWIDEEMKSSSKFEDEIITSISDYYERVVLKSKEGVFELQEGKKNNTLTIRCDILPVAITKFNSILKGSVKDVLLTGDQSLTDGLLMKKTVWYQIAPWKKNLAVNLAKELPNNYLKSEKTSCGKMGKITLKINIDKFIKKYDFNKNGKKIIDKLIK